MPVQVPFGHEQAAIAQAGPDTFDARGRLVHALHSRIVGVSINTVTKLLMDAGEACEAHHDEHVRGVNTRRVECDEIWAFCYAKQKNAGGITGETDHAGDVWTWTALASDSRMMLSWMVSPGRDSGYAIELMDDLRGKLANRVQLPRTATAPTWKPSREPLAAT